MEIFKSRNHYNFQPTSPDSGSDVKKETEEPWGPVPNPLDYISSEERELIESIVIYQDKYELPTDSDIKKLEVGCCFYPELRSN